MSYKVIRPFKDLADPENHDYAVGDIFPRDGYEPTDSFTNGLLTGANTAGSIFLEVLGEDEPKKPASKTEEVKEEPAVEQEETVEETAEEPAKEVEE
ncbi:hypothetical protein HMPREF2957_07410 [Streptococcus sp. HMSC062D07]|uniref:hypothetical protein n=1 Tax=Streptococcus sp. HMSC062D07 TaxID=1739461 RepID=UPI0008A15847|nr:hypothetical protein [Streptococcus sp. HMSC062D07]OFQ06675.1 hypothetical protein HMPREF2957_07410 [Streptococcus sp. HMSC062D07]